MIMQDRTLFILQIICWIGFAVIVVFLFLAKKYSTRFFDFLPQISITNKIKNLLVVLTDTQCNKTIFLSIFYSLIFTALVAIARMILFFSFHYDSISFSYILYTSTLLQIFSMVPISLNSLGVTESLGTFFYSQIGVPGEVSLAIIIIGRISAIVTSSLGGILNIFPKKID